MQIIFRYFVRLLKKRVENSAYAKVSAHYAIAMLSLAKRDRAAAEKHFAEGVATNTHGCEHYEMARAYSTRLTADANWPSWLVGDRSANDHDGPETSLSVQRLSRD